ncbi:PorT family protein [Saprospiraceae bacterium]|nr:PorT family protein [Saprospiraceae bacterium]
MNNLKSLVLVTICSLFAISANSQWSYGLKAGYTNAWEDYGEVELPENAEIDIHGFNIAVLSAYSFSKYFDFTFEPGIVKRGAACVPGWGPVFEGDTKFHLSYIDLPFFVQSNIPLYKDQIHMFCKVGTGLSFLTKVVREEDPLDIDEPSERIKMNFSSFNRIDCGVYASGGISYSINGYQIFIESAYYRGFVDAEKANFSKNNNVNISIGYRYSKSL